MSDHADSLKSASTLPPKCRNGSKTMGIVSKSNNPLLVETSRLMTKGRKTSPELRPATGSPLLVI